MNKIFTTISALLLFVSVSNAQVEIKVNPVGLIFSQPDVSLEFVVKEKIGIELSNIFVYGNVPLSGLLLGGPEFRLSKSGYRIRFSGKYYFSPKVRGAGAYAGAYFGPRNLLVSGDRSAYGFDPGYKLSAFSVGLLGGYKHIFESGLLIDLQVGLGYGFNSTLILNDSNNTNEIAVIGVEGIRAVSIGYRFNLGSSDKKKKR